MVFGHIYLRTVNIMYIKYDDDRIIIGVHDSKNNNNELGKKTTYESMYIVHGTLLLHMKLHHSPLKLHFFLCHPCFCLKKKNKMFACFVG